IPLPSAVSATSNVSIVRFNLTLSCPCGSNHNCNINLVTVWANGCTGSSSHVLPVVASRYDGIDSINGIIIGSLSCPSTLNVSLASSISINIVCPPYKQRASNNGHPSYYFLCPCWCL